MEKLSSKFREFRPGDVTVLQMAVRSNRIPEKDRVIGTRVRVVKAFHVPATVSSYGEHLRDSVGHSQWVSVVINRRTKIKCLSALYLQPVTRR